MATYEVLEPGGHAQLVSDIKTYVNRADGVGTTQLADESVTMDKLGEDVIDELDDIMHDGDPLNGNVLFGELAESIVLTADDVYAAPPKGVEVYGKSTQDGTPTPDVPVEIKSVDDCVLNITGKNLCGGSALLANIQAAMPQVTTGSDMDGDYVRFTGSMATTSGKDIATGMFKPNTQYTFVIKSAHESSGIITQTRILYTDGGATVIEKNGTVDTAGTVVITSIAGKTVKSLQAVWVTGTTRLYYDSCGIFEGVLTADQFEPYVGQSIEIPLSNHVGRSLPDGTRDTLTLTYQGPSTEHEGWGVFGAELVQKLASTTITSFSQFSTTSQSGHYRVRHSTQSSAGVNNSISNRFTYNSSTYNYGVPGDYYISSGYIYVIVPDSLNSLEKVNEWAAENPTVLQYKLATPITHNLGTIELPILPNPLTAWADGGSAQPTMQMEYERDVNIVIAQLEAQIAELLTS